ncbi:MAG: DUF2851 family protein [Opitutaceae bacterium]
MTRKTSVRGVAEIQGLYGPFSFPEKLLQKIWSRGEFDRLKAVTLDGRHVQVLYPGKWNLLGGPDFKGARLRLADGPVIAGDVELHLTAEGWAEHGHAKDRAYDGVVLHVVLFPPEPAHATHGADETEIAVLVLLPLLLHDLEEFAAEDAVENLANRPMSRVQEVLGTFSAKELMTLLRNGADRRWLQKVHFARLRVKRLGWEEACHHAALEILGYRFNRAPMLRIASAHPLREWARGAVVAEAVYEEEAGSWSLQGVRPANRPLIRLRQYLRWIKANPDWPLRLMALKQNLPVVGAVVPTGAARRVNRFATLRRAFRAEICADAVGGTRFDNLFCDGFLPLLAAETAGDLAGLWWHWYPGDLPPGLAQSLRGLAVVGARDAPASHGLGQGLLGWLIERERAELISAGRGA